MNKENIFTSTGVKILHHPEVLRRAKEGYGTPISLQMSLTSKCNLNCVFCSNTNRTKNEELEASEVYILLSQLKAIGLKTVEWTGGGDPSLHPYVNPFIGFAHSIGLKQGFISNGIATARNLLPESLGKLWWMRISLNCLDYVDDIEVPQIGGTLGFSYVMNELTMPNTIKKLRKYAKKYNPAYIRIVPNCLATNEEQDRNNRILSEEVADWGEPFFYQAKRFEKPINCWWGYFKPFVNHDGSVFRCSSVVLNPDSNRTFHEMFKWCTIQGLPKMYESKMVGYDPKKCDHCVFTNQNNAMDAVINPNGMIDFI